MLEKPTVSHNTKRIIILSVACVQIKIKLKIHEKDNSLHPYLKSCGRFAMHRASKKAL